MYCKLVNWIPKHQFMISELTFDITDHKLLCKFQLHTFSCHREKKFIFQNIDCAFASGKIFFVRHWKIYTIKLRERKIVFSTKVFSWGNQNSVGFFSYQLFSEVQSGNPLESFSFSTSDWLFVDFKYLFFMFQILGVEKTSLLIIILNCNSHYFNCWSSTFKKTFSTCMDKICRFQVAFNLHLLASCNQFNFSTISIK